MNISNVFIHIRLNTLYFPFLPCRLKNIRCRKYSIASIKQISTDAGKHQITLTGQEMHFSIYAAPKEYATVLELLRSRIPVSDSTLSQQWNKSI